MIDLGEQMIAPLGGDAPSVSQRIRECTRCGVGLRLQSPTADLPALPWLCNSCGSVYFACWHGDAPNGDPGGCRMASYDKVLTVIVSHLDLEADAVTRAQLDAFVNRAAANALVGEELRQRPRHPLVTPVIAVPLGPDFRVTGRPARMFTLDVSQSGMRLLHSKAVNSPMLALDFTNGDSETVSVILCVQRTRATGSVYEIAGPLLSRIVRTP
jgi:hypothetical protein